MNEPSSTGGGMSLSLSLSLFLSFSLSLSLSLSLFLHVCRWWTLLSTVKGTRNMNPSTTASASHNTRWAQWNTHGSKPAYCDHGREECATRALYVLILHSMTSSMKNSLEKVWAECYRISTTACAWINPFASICGGLPTRRIDSLTGLSPTRQLQIAAISYPYLFLSHFILSYLISAYTVLMCYFISIMSWCHYIWHLRSKP